MFDLLIVFTVYRVRMFDLIIFDCDGTLVDSEYFNNSVTCNLLAERGLQQYTIDYAMTHFVGLKFSEILKKIHAETGHVFPKDFGKIYMRRIQETMADHIKPVEGIKEAVVCAGHHAKLAVVSNGGHQNVLDSIKLAGLSTYFADGHNVVTGLMADKPKPAPDLFLLVAQNLDVDPSRALVIEDSVQGVQGAKAAGMTCWGFIGTAHDPVGASESLKKAGADQIIDKLIHICTMLGS